MTRRVGWIAAAALLLAAGWSALLLALYGLLALRGEVTPESHRAVRAGLLAAWLVVGAKGLLPQVVLAGLLTTAAEAARPALGDSRLRLAVAIVVASVAAYAVVGPLLLTTDHAAAPGLHPRNTLEHVGTLASTRLGVETALWLPRAWSLRRRPPPAGRPAAREIG